MTDCKKTQEARNKAVQSILEQMLEWYAVASLGAIPEAIAEDKRAYRGKILRWLEPIIPGYINPVLIEEFLGDSWTLRMEPMQPKITNLTRNTP